jgi:hypothetical protein
LDLSVHRFQINGLRHHLFCPHSIGLGCFTALPFDENFPAMMIGIGEINALGNSMVDGFVHFDASGDQVFVEFAQLLDRTIKLQRDVIDCLFALGDGIFKKCDVMVILAA